MKKIYLITILLFSLHSFSQNDLLGEWTLHEIFIDGVTQQNMYPSQYFKIYFTTNIGSETNNKIFDGGGLCNSLYGEYDIEPGNQIHITTFTSTLAFCSLFENSYTYFFHRVVYPSTQYVTYSITGTGNDQTLVLTDADDNYVQYGRQALSVEEQTLNKVNFRITENPVKENLKLDINNVSDSEYSYQVFSIDGKEVIKTSMLDTNTFNVSEFHSGIYVLVITTKDNFKQILKFVK